VGDHGAGRHLAGATTKTGGHVTIKERSRPALILIVAAVVAVVAVILLRRRPQAEEA
jgi:hypothetical protein